MGRAFVKAMALAIAGGYGPIPPKPPLFITPNSKYVLLFSFCIAPTTQNFLVAFFTFYLL